MNKRLSQFKITIIVSFLVLLTIGGTSCCKRSGLAEQEYKSLDGTGIRIISSTEFEITERTNNFGRPGSLTTVGTYSVDKNVARMVLEALGTKTALYFDVTEDGLKDNQTGKIFYSSTQYDIKKKALNEQALQKEAELTAAAAQKEAELTKKKAELTAAAAKAVTKTIDLGGGVSMDFVLIPSGSFQMGGPDTKPQRDANDEGPVHTVNITQSFYLGKYEVTQAQWQQVMSSNPSQFKGDFSRPIESVTWNDCQTFITTMNKKGIGTYRLPTEAEWEYACRAGSTTAYYWGDSMDENYCWYIKNSGSTTHPVGQKTPNAWGLYDMSGNVWEWCNDCDGAYPSGAVNDPLGPTAGERRVIRGGGGGRYNFCAGCRSALRFVAYPSDAGDYVGVRLVLLNAQALKKAELAEARHMAVALSNDPSTLIAAAITEYKCACERQYRLFSSKDSTSVTLALENLALLRPPMFVEQLATTDLPTGEVGVQVAMTAAMIDDETCHVFLKKLAAGTGKAKPVALAALRIFHNEGDTAELEFSFRTASPEAKIAIAKLLGMKSSTFYTPLLKEVYERTTLTPPLSTKTAEVAIAAARAVWRTGDYSSHKVIMEFAQSNNASERATGFEALCLFADPVGLACLERGVEDPDPSARIRALLSLYDTIPESDIPEIAKKIAQSASIKAGSNASTIEKQVASRVRTISALNNLSREKNLPLVEITRSELEAKKSPEEKAAIVAAVSEMKNFVALDYLVLENVIRVAREGTEDEKTAALESLKKLKTRYNELP